MELISVIVPVYRSEKFLGQCIESIVNQSYNNLEIILINDGSPDNSGRICDYWAEKDSRIKVIHKINEGAGKARNVGMDCASGDFVTFVDSDDYISGEMLEYLHGLMKDDVDLTECESIVTESNQCGFDSVSSGRFEAYSPEAALKLHIEDKLFKQVIHGKLFRKNLLEGVRFPIGTLIDDEFFTYKALGNAKKTVHAYCKLYAYRQQEDSLMHKAFSLERLTAIDAKSERIDYLKTRFPALNDHAVINFRGTCMFLGQMSLTSLSREDTKKAFTFINNALKKHPLRLSCYKKLNMQYKIWALLSRLSFRLTCKIRNLLKIGI